MPIYEYKCGKCGVIEVMQRITEGPLKKCPTCRGKVERQISRGSFILKGSGWYATDYAKKGTSNGTDTSASSTVTDSSAAASTSETSKKPSVESKDSKPASTEMKSSSSEKTAAAKPAA